jgi:hypothetical protein
MSPESFDRYARPTLQQVPVSPGLVLCRPESIRERVEQCEDDPPGG